MWFLIHGAPHDDSKVIHNAHSLLNIMEMVMIWFIDVDGMYGKENNNEMFKRIKISRKYFFMESVKSEKHICKKIKIRKNVIWVLHEACQFILKGFAELASCLSSEKSNST